MEQINQLDNAEEVLELSNSWEEKGIKKVALGMLRENLPVELIAKVTGLKIEDIEKIRATL